MRLNLGSSNRNIDGFTGVDIAPPADVIFDLSEPWTKWEDSSVDEVLALDIAEHIGDCDHQASLCVRCYPTRRGRASGCQICGMMPCYLVDDKTDLSRLSPECLPRWRHPLGRIHFLNELHRVLKPGARATIETPNAARGCGFPCDPTHLTPWCLSTFRYFEKGSFAHTRLANSYGITAAFKIVSLEEARFPCEFSPQQVAYVDPPFGVWVPGGAEVAWKIRAVLESVKA